MSSPQSSGSDIILVVLAFILLSVVRRTYATRRGTRFTVTRTTLLAVVYVAVGCLFSAVSFFEGVSPLLAAPYALVLALAALWSYRYTDRRIAFWKGSDGTVYFRGGVMIYVIYVVGLVARLSIDYLLMGPGMFSFSAITALTGTALYGTVATDLLLLFGVGLLLGRNLRVLERYRRIEHGGEQIPDIPNREIS